MRIRRCVREREAPLTERIAVDLAEIIADIAVALVRVFKLQDVGRALRDGDLERVTSIGRRAIGLGVGAGVGGEGVSLATACRVLDADEYVGGEGAFVDDECLPRGAGASAGCV